MRTIVGLAIVIGVIYGLYWVLKQVKASREDKAPGAGLKTLATLPLGQNRAMHLVRAGDEVVLVGVGEARRHADPHLRRERGPRARPARRRGADARIPASTSCCPPRPSTSRSALPRRPCAA